MHVKSPWFQPLLQERIKIIVQHHGISDNIINHVKSVISQQDKAANYQVVCKHVKNASE